MANNFYYDFQFTSFTQLIPTFFYTYRRKASHVYTRSLIHIYAKPHAYRRIGSHDYSHNASRIFAIINGY